MALGAAPLDSIDLDNYQRTKIADDLKHTYGCVWPDGRVTEHVCRPPKKGDIGQRSGDTPLLWMNDGVVVRKTFKRRGCKLFDDVCIADLGASEGAKKVAQWREALRLRATVKIKNPDDLYPPSVLKARREHATGVSEDMVFIPGEGLVPATEEKKAERVSSVLAAADLPVPTADDRAEAKKAK